MEVLWRSDAVMNNVGKEVRLLDVDGDKVFEVGLPDKIPFYKRVGLGLRYMFQASPVTLGLVTTDEEFRNMCERVVKNDR